MLYTTKDFGAYFTFHWKKKWKLFQKWRPITKHKNDVSDNQSSLEMFLKPDPLRGLLPPDHFLVSKFLQPAISWGNLLYSAKPPPTHWLQMIENWHSKVIVLLPHSSISPGSSCQAYRSPLSSLWSDLYHNQLPGRGHLLPRQTLLLTPKVDQALMMVTWW